MLIVCNGSPKTGTTWVVQFFKVQSKSFLPTPVIYNNNATNPMLDASVLSSIDSYSFYKKAHFYTKVHLVDEDWALGLLDKPNVRVVSIVRDVRDQFVSRYHHDKRFGAIAGDRPFNAYFASHLRRRIEQMMNYNRFWYQKPGAGPITTSYEFLKADPTRALVRFRDALRLEDPTCFDIELVREKTDFARAKNSGTGKFKRKGIVGDYKNHMSEAQNQRFLNRLRAAGYNRIKRRIARLYPYLEPYLATTDVGLE